MSSHEKDVYGGNYSKAKRLAIARSAGKCQFCGLRKAEEGHHWAWPDYPSGEEVQGHDITALCKVCHELATMLRDWVERKYADFDEIEEEIKASSSFYEKREAFSYWLFPEDEEETGHSYSEWTPEPSKFRLTENTSPKSHLSVEDQIDDLQLQLDVMKDLRESLERQMDRMRKGESLQSSSAQKDARHIAKATFLAVDAGWNELETEYKATGQQMGKLVGQLKPLRKGKKKSGKKEFNTCGYYLSLLFFLFMACALSTILPRLNW